ncbi:MAG: hypothetical protein JW954_05930 [Dehalococcoidaceae bacterium]|nr:hypothetical protein [Dehalococcoidaceae bacterium]
MNMLKMMATNEELIGRLYRQYAAKFPKYSNFWNNLAREEDTHASWLISLYQQAGAGLLSIDDKRFNESAIKRFSEYLQIEIDRLHKEQFSLVAALSMALHIEEALIERKYFEVLGADCPDLKNTLERLKSETEVHLRKVKEELAKHIAL